MPFRRALPSEIDQALSRDWAVLTANQRAARTLRRAYDLRQHALGLAVWEPPRILAWDQWTFGLWDRLLLDGHVSSLLLSSAQEHTLWRAIVAADAATVSLRPPDALAQTAAGAWKLLHDYRGRQRLQSFPGNSDTRAFARWAAEFERRCARAQYLTEAQLPEVLRAAAAAEQIAPGPGYLLVGFDSKTPAQESLLGAIQAAGAEIDEFKPIQPSPSLTLVSASDEPSELAACAHWLRDRLTQQPAASIAVIVPAIEPARAEIDRVFRHVLAPELDDIAAPSHSAPYEFSLGVPLARTPLVAAALDILRWVDAPLPLDRVSALLLSPHFAADPLDSAESIARAEFDAFVLRQQRFLQPQLSLDELRSLVAGPRHSPNLPALLHHLRALADRRDAAPLTYAGWAVAFHNLLDAAGWAPLAHLDSIEFQTRTKWDEALDELASLDFDSRGDGTRVSFSIALTALELIATETVFAPESLEAPVQIMSPLESAGSSFDAIWFLRANDAAWPSASSPNPLLPWPLQRDLAMPGANPVLDSENARRITHRIAASAPTVLFSYAQQTADGRQRLSPILTHLALERIPAAQIAPAEPVPAPVQLEAFRDNISIPPPPDRVLQGGAGILQSQAACGFRAFAEKRLFSTALDSAALGLDARERGNLVHLVLEDLWARVDNQAALQRMTSGARDAQLIRSINAALARHYARPGAGWPRAYLDTERDRLLQLLRPWLDYEASQRKPFAVLAREQKLEDVTIGPLRLDIRVDRVDLALDENGEPLGEIILDYKTGQAKPADWLGDRPDAPQLPLYAVVSNPQHLAAVAFASVRPGKDMGLRGYQSRDGILPQNPKLNASSLAAQVDEWRSVLTSLAEDFHAGHASVSPKSYPKTCEYCQQRLLCRLDPSTLEAPVLDDSGADAETSDAEVDRG
jgi:probable DNA repair protein